MENWLKKVEEEMKLKVYSPRTMTHYLRCLREYFRGIIEDGGDISVLDQTGVRAFLIQKHHKNYSSQTVNLYLSAITFFYRNVMKNYEKISVRFAKKASKLPVVLSRDEISKILESIENRKHTLMIGLAYGSGLRVSEVVNVRVQDIDLDTLSLVVRAGKGNKDRLTVFPEKLVDSLNRYMAGKRGRDYIFESERGGRLTTRTAQKVFENALEKVGIKKNATFHSLRHSFATHLIENGVNLRYVQMLLGHRNVKTTQRYTQVTAPSLKKIKSPL